MTISAANSRPRRQKLNHTVMDPYPYSMLQFEVTVGKDNDTPFMSTIVEWVNRIMIFCVCIVGR